MRFTKIATDAFEKFQLNAGVLTTNFDPASPGSFDEDDIFMATSGGTSFTATPEYSDFGEDVDNVPANTKELKKLTSVTATMSGTGKTLDTTVAKALMAAADVNSSTGKITPRADLLDDDFIDLWWVGDYSDHNGDTNGGFVAIHLINALSTGGFQLQSNDKGKADFAFEFTGHYSINDIETVPYEVYIVDGSAEYDVTLSALTISGVTLSPTFSSGTSSYTASTTAATNTVTATATDTNATVVIKNGSTTVTSGSTASWSSGANTLTVTVTNGGASKVYTVTVTKS